MIKQTGYFGGFAGPNSFVSLTVFLALANRVVELGDEGRYEAISVSDMPMPESLLGGFLWPIPACLDTVCSDPSVWNFETLIGTPPSLEMVALIFLISARRAFFF